MGVLVGLVQLVVVPGILSSVLIHSVLVARRMPDPHARRASRAGFWAGIALTTLVVVLRSGSVVPGEPLGARPMHLDALGLSWGALAGVVLWLSLRRTPYERRFIGLLTIVLTATSSLGLFTYIADATWSDVIISGSLTTTAVVLVLVAVWPKSVASPGQPPIIYQ
jgi:hypothetical protein